MRSLNIVLYIILTGTAFVTGCKDKINCDYEPRCVETAPGGYMIGTMSSDINTVPRNQVATLFRTLHNAQAPIGNNWNDPSAGVNRVQSVFPKNWVSDSIGQVFGIALDHEGGVYLSATDVYKFDGLLALSYNGGVGWSSGVGPAGPAGIYYTNYNSINTTIPLVKTLNSSNANTVNTNLIPSTGFFSDAGNSIGNIAFDYAHNQLFATNLEDGRIYRIDPATGKVKSILDPFVIDNGTAGKASIGEQLWGIGVFTSGGITRVYFARTTLPHISSNITAVGGVEIWSVSLTSAGEFNAGSGIGGLFTAPAGSGFIIQEISLTQGHQTKVTDIAFSRAGRMLLAERGNPHASAIFEYVNANGISGLWVPGNNFYTGADLSVFNPAVNLPGKNASGGVDYSERENLGQIPEYACSDIVWATGNFMPTLLLPLPPAGAYPNFVYGAQGMSGSGNNSNLNYNISHDLYIDYNCTGTPVAPGYPASGHTSTVKNRIGDIEVFDQTCSCKGK